VEQRDVSNNSTVFETLSGAHLFYKDWGGGKPVVFLSTRAQTSDMWQYQMIRMVENGLRCIAYDRRGHGRSDQPASGYDFDTLSDDLASLLDQLDLTDVTLVGHSMGGGEIIRYLTRHGARRVSRAAFVASATPMLKKTADNPNGFDPAALSATTAAIRIDFPKWLADITDPFFTPDTSPAMKQWSVGMALQTSVLAAATLDRALANEDFREELKHISIPCLVIHGGNDVFAPLELCGRPTAQLITNSKLAVYEDGHHGIPLTHIEKLSADLISFIRS
jgi:non-heme chloroperoxidase